MHFNLVMMSCPFGIRNSGGHCSLKLFLLFLLLFLFFLIFLLLFLLLLSPMLTENGYKQSKPPTAPKPDRLLKQYSTLQSQSSPETQSPSTSSTDQTNTPLKESRQEQPAPPTPLPSSSSSSAAAPVTDQPPPLPTSAPPSKAARLGMRRHTVSETESPKHSHHQEEGGGGGGGFAGGLGNLHVHSSQTEHRRSPLGTISESPSPDRHAVAAKQPSPPTEVRPSRSEAFPLKVFMETKAKDLPFQIHVDTGLYGNTMHSSLHPQDTLTAHFVMRTNVLRAALDRGGTYHIPCGSSNQFSLLFDPKNNIIEAMNGFYFESAADMMSHTPLPPVIRAVRSFQGSSSDFSVQEGDILLVSRRVKSRGVPKRKYISCYKAGTGEKKRLTETCTAGFTTRPEEIQLPLSEILSCRYTPLPLKAIMYYVGPSQDSPQVYSSGSSICGVLRL